MPLFASDAERAQVDIELRQVPTQERRNKIQLGSMTNEDFRWWILEEASQSIQSSKITHVTWWEERHTVLKHQFIIMRFEHKEYGNPTTIYEVRLERAGKAIFSLASQAIDKATISTDLTLGNGKILDGHKLLFALLTDKVLDPGNMNSDGDRSPVIDHSVEQGTNFDEGETEPSVILAAGHPAEGSNHADTAVQSVDRRAAERSANGNSSLADRALDEDKSSTTGTANYPEPRGSSESLGDDDVFYYNAFEDFLDEKWSGPPLRLLDLARYLGTILENRRYSLASANCFWYARLIMHTIALRHYSFPLLATSTDASKFIIPRTGDNIHYGTQRISWTRWRKHDPSSISLLFRYLHYEEWRNGILMYRRLVLINVTLLYLAFTAALGYALHLLYFVRDSSISKGTGIFMVALLGVAILTLVGHLLKWPVRRMIAGLTYYTIRKGTGKMADKLDRKFTAKEEARGDYIPIPIPLVQVRVGWSVVHGGGTSAVVGKYTMEVADKPRTLPQRWENEAQICAGKQREYEAAWRRLQA
ncbi:hypothetical protein C8R47DRAFT_1162531 [Mycena vitilis]|nr:hypothetical protein C8R47DRAFT_1162531 [Mycena vitilis]